MTRTTYAPAALPTAAELWAEYVAMHRGDLGAAYHELLTVSSSVGLCRLALEALTIGQRAIRDRDGGRS